MDKNKMDKRITILESLSKESMTILQRLDDRMEHMDHIIRGNGSPGLVTQIEVLQTKTDAISKTLEDQKETSKDDAKTKKDHNWQWVYWAITMIVVEGIHWLVR